MDDSSLERPDLPVLFFRTACDLGHAIELHKGPLAGTVRTQSFFSFLCERSAAWMDTRFQELADLDYQQHVTFVRNLIAVEMRAKKSAEAKAVYRAMLADLQSRPPADLATLLRTMAAMTHHLVGQAMTKVGGPLSASRWTRCDRADLRFMHGERGPTRCTFDQISVSGGTSTNVITIRIGDHIDRRIDGPRDQRKGALRIYFNLRFYIFHEYVSHAFSVWQEERFVEGYLVWAARQMLFETATPDLVRKRFVEDTFKGSSYGDLRMAEDAADWFQSTTGGRFLTVLLEWAADEIVTYEDSDVDMLWGVPIKADGDSQISDYIRLIFQNMESRSILSALRELARRASGVQPFQPRLRRAD